MLDMRIPVCLRLEFVIVTHRDWNRELDSCKRRVDQLWQHVVAKA